MAKRKGFIDLKKSVIDRGLCTSCGTCVGVCASGCIRFDYDKEEPISVDTCTGCGQCYAVCPGRDIPIFSMEKTFLGEVRTGNNEYLGVHKQLLKGYAKDETIRKVSASGGVTTALLLHALEKGMIDGAVVAGMDEKKPWRVKPRIARTPEQIINAAKSKYVICPSNEVLRDIKENERVAVVGLPCHVHGLRKIQLSEDLAQLAGQIVFVIGIYCGSNRSYYATEHLIKESSDVDLNEITRFDYRGGDTGQDVKIYTQKGEEITIATAERSRLFQWFVRGRCRMCYDWTAEVSDISLGDIFHHSVKTGWGKIPGWNSVIVRNEKGMDLIQSARENDKIELSVLEEETFYGNFGFMSKKRGAVYQICERRQYGLPTPEYGLELKIKPKRRTD